MVGREAVDRAREEETKKGRGRIALEQSEEDGRDAKVVGGGEGEKELIPTKLALVSTIQFVAAVAHLRSSLESDLPPLDDELHPSTTLAEEGALVKRTTADEEQAEVERRLWRGKYEIVIPQARPLSPGEILGCTAPKLADDVDALM